MSDGALRSPYEVALEEARGATVCLWERRIVCAEPGCGKRVGTVRSVDGHLLFSAKWPDSAMDDAMRLPGADPHSPEDERTRRGVHDGRVPCPDRLAIRRARGTGRPAGRALSPVRQARGRRGGHSTTACEQGKGDHAAALSGVLVHKLAGVEALEASLDAAVAAILAQADATERTLGPTQARHVRAQADELEQRSERTAARAEHIRQQIAWRRKALKG